MGKHTKFESSDDESSSNRRDETSSRKKEKKEKRDKADRVDEKKAEKVKERERSRSPRERRESHKDIKQRDDYRDQRRDRDRRDHYRNDSYKREDRGNRRDRDFNDRNSDRRNNREPEKKRLTEEELKAQRKALWGNKKKETGDTQTGENTNGSESTAAPAPVAKNEKLWSSAIEATGVGSSQANKFMRLMGVKNAPKVTDDASQLSSEKERQIKMMSDLERQYAIAREATHMGRGNGLGFH